MVDDIIMIKFRNKALECHVEIVDSYFTKTENKIFYMCRGSLQDFYWKKGTRDILDVVCPHLNVGKNYTIFVQYIKMGYS